MEYFVNIIYVLAALGITGLVLIQHGKGADMGASFGSGASQTIFGSVGSGNALTKATAWLALVFIVCSLFLAVMARQRADQSIQDTSLIQNSDQLENLINAVPPAVVESAVDSAVDSAVEMTVDPDVPTVGITADGAGLDDDQLNQAIQTVIDTVQAAGENLDAEAENTLEQVQQATDNQ